jgi:transposase
MLNNILLQNNEESRLYKTAKLFLLLNEKKDYKTISSILDISSPSIKRLKLKYFNEGLNSLFLVKKRGCNKNKLSEKDELQFIDLIKKIKPKPKYNVRWTLNLLTEEWNSNSINQNKQISKYTIRRILKKHNIDFGSQKTTIGQLEYLQEHPNC